MNYFGWMLLVLIGLPRLVWATVQEPDLLLYQGDTLLLQANPLEQWLAQLPTRPAELSKAGSTACWRGYQATWQLAGDTLYLLRVAPCAPEDAGQSLDLRPWFVPDAHGRVAATWVTGRLAVALGQMLCYNTDEIIYEYDWLLTFRRGQLMQQQRFDNQSCRDCGLPTPTSQAVFERLHRAVAWAQVPRQHGQYGHWVVVKFQPDSTGHGSLVEVVRKAGAPYDALALAAARRVAVAEWGACYRFGRWQPRTWTMLIRFNESNRRRYQAALPRRKPGR
jgi:hypothetical protein